MEIVGGLSPFLWQGLCFTLLTAIIAARWMILVGDQIFTVFFVNFINEVSRDSPVLCAF